MSPIKSLVGKHARLVLSYCKKQESIAQEELTVEALRQKQNELESRMDRLRATYFEESDECEEGPEWDAMEAEYENANEFYGVTLSALEWHISTKEKAARCTEDVNDTNSSGTPKAAGCREDFTTPSSTPVYPTQSLRLPTLNIPIFEGGYSKWPAFRDLFCGIFQNLSSGQKLAHLHDRTKGEAKEIVARFEILDANFEVAWQALIDRYENPRILVHQQLKKLFGIQSIQQESPKSLRVIQSTINDSLAIFKSHKVDVTSWDPILNHLCSTKIPDDTLRAWEDSLPSHKELPTWSQMDSFLSARIEKLETVLDLRKPVPRENNHNKTQAFHTNTQEEDNNTCPKCKQRHALWHCKQFVNATPQERNKMAMSTGCCLNCLSRKHFLANCTSNRGCKKCGRKHHTMLHYERNGSREQVSQSQPGGSTGSRQQRTPQQEEVNAHFSRSSSTTILPTALVDIYHAGQNFTVRALLDGGAERSFVSSRTQQQLQLPIRNHRAQISGVGGTVITKSKGQCRIHLKSKKSNFNIDIEAIIVPKLSHFLPSRPVKLPNLSDFEQFDLADPLFAQPGPIDLILGSDVLPFINCEGTRILEGCLEARASRLGWYISGPAPTDHEIIQTFSTTVTVTEDSDLCQQLKRFWDIEEVEIPKLQCENDIYCEELYRSTTQRGADGKYVVRLPFKKEFPQEIYLGPTKYMALAQYRRMEATLSKTPELEAQYSAVLQEYEDLHHMEEVPGEEKGDRVFNFFLPHHAVVKPESTSTKVRVVFNASKKSKSGFALNDVLHTGPTLQADIIQIITNWRFYEYVFTGDIQKMYRQIWVHENDRPYQQIVFRPDKNGPVKNYQLKTVTFGVNCAPFLAIRTLQQLSEDVKVSNPQASEILAREVYVDDILSGGYSLPETIQKQSDLRKALGSAGFPLKKLTANHKSLLSNLPREDLLDEEFLLIDTSSITKTLGVRWNALEDCFSYSVQQMPVPESVTKRQMLSVVAKLYDPQGWIGPVVIIAKIFLQEIWELKTEWDERVPEGILSRWVTFLANLPFLSKIRLPRWVHYDPECSIQLHAFCDASEKAFCGAIYIRTTSTKGHHCHLIVAKTKVAPLQQLTIPKLELSGALLVTKLLLKVSKHLQMKHGMFLWTDSAIVLGWLQRKPHTLKTFVANRIAEIQRLVEVSQWKHVRTEDNPADLGSRGCTPQELESNPIWWHGPSWLKLPETKWPTPRSFEPTELEVKVSVHFTVDADDDITARFSSLERCLRVVAYLFRFVNRAKDPNRGTTTSQLDLEEIEFAKRRLIYIAQCKYFQPEIDCLQKKCNLSRRSTLITLNPFLDEDGILRVGGRLNNSELSFNARHPIIIPSKSRTAELLIKFTHQFLLHAEFNGMLRAIRQGYHIPQLKNLIRRCIRNCKPCTIYKHKFQKQLMGTLPPERVQFSLPFTYTGVDFAGPFSLKSSKLKNAKVLKGYAAVFVCFSTKAVHLETCSELTTEAFHATFARFTGRRGLPKTMFSDNGRNFLGTSRALLKEETEFLRASEKSINQKYLTHGFKWSFIPPYSPHMGGLWESAVKSMKSHLKKITTNLTFTFEEFTTLLIRVEAVLNSRPLSPMSQNPSELLPITPSHLLRGAPLIAPPEAPSNVSLEKISHLQRWERIKILQHHFAKRWKNEYITELQRRYKWKTKMANIQLDDFVIVKDDLLPPTEWKLGRVTRLYHGRDNHVRVADILTQSGTVTRPLVKLCVLPTQDQ